MTNVVSVGDNKVDTMYKVLVCIAHRLYDDNDSVKNQDNTYRSDVQVIFFILTAISDIYRSFIPNKTPFIKYWLTQLISKFPGSFEIHSERQCVANFTNLVCIVSATVYKT